MKGFRQKISKPMVHEHQKDAVGEPLFWQLHLKPSKVLDDLFIARLFLEKQLRE